MRAARDRISENVVVVAGMPRGGTTFLYHNLQRHPEIFAPYRKELHYFFFNRSRGDDWFERFFASMGPGQVGVDISPAYFLDSRSIEHMLEYRPDMKVVLSIRDPVDWSLSLYSQLSTFNFRMPPFAEFIERYEHRIAYTDFELRLADGLVSHMVSAYRAAFGDNLLLYDFKLLRDDLPAVMSAIERFIGVAPYFNAETIDSTVINASARANFRFFTWLMSREPLVNALGKVFPARVLRGVRGKLDAAASGKVTKSGPELHPPETRELAARAFAKQRAEISSLFAEHRIVLGSGSPFL